MPFTQEKHHSANKLYLTITNWGFYGSRRGDDTPLYCITDELGECLPSAEYPGESGIEYLFQGALWIGAVVEGDTLVSLGTDGWMSDWNQFYPGNLASDSIYRLSTSGVDDTLTIDGREFIARSDQDYISRFTDVLTDDDYVPPEHLSGGIRGIKIIQRSSAWDVDSLDNVIFIQQEIKNISDRTFRNLYIGMYIDGDCGHIDMPAYMMDDLTGYIEEHVDSASGDTTDIFTAWLADNDGDPEDSTYNDSTSPTGALGLVFLNDEDFDHSYHWWFSNTDESLDWGPWLEVNDRGWDGTPSGLKRKYQLMSNGEIDFDQCKLPSYYEDSTDWVWSTLSGHFASNIADGYETKFLHSVGPLNLPAGEKKTLNFAIFVAESFHTNPLNTGDDLDCSEYNYSTIIKNAQKCIEFYDGRMESISGDVRKSPAMQVNISPNPFSERVRIKTPKSTTITIYNISGKKVTTLQENIWKPSSKVKAGVYLIKVESKRRVSFSKVIYLK